MPRPQRPRWRRRFRLAATASRMTSPIWCCSWPRTKAASSLARSTASMAEWARCRLLAIPQNRGRRRIPRGMSPPFLLTAFDTQPDLPALRGEPVLAAHCCIPAQRRLILTVLAKVAIAVELRFELTRHELRHQGVV